MKIHDLIFSDNNKIRVLRHSMFWAVVLLEKIGTSASYYLESPTTVPLILFSPEVLLPDLALLMGYCYLVVYWMVPDLWLKRRYFLFASLLLILTLALELVKLHFMGFNFHIPKDQQIFLAWMKAASLINTGPQVTCVVFISIKLVKNVYLKEEESLKLMQENANAELQLLKAQIHPHFLFNTLNNIYSFTLSKSAIASDLVLKLLSLLQYMINDCNAALVPLEKELKMIEDYIGLEKVRYNNRMKIRVQINNEHNKLIPPLLLIPFIENSFKHGASQMIEDPWIDLRIDVTEEYLHFELSNSKPIVETSARRRGIGLSNVRKRLQLLYPENHELSVVNGESRFKVIMIVPLQNEITLGDVVAKPIPIPDALPA